QPNQGISQDPEWLKSWELAESQKPTTLKPTSRIADENEPGQPFIIKGQIFNPDGYPASKVIVHAYHRDANGFDFGKGDQAQKTWRLQAWAKTDRKGRFEFQTIRPAPDHFGREGAHIHFTLVTKDFGKQWAPKVFLTDDPNVTESLRLRSKAMGPYAWVCPVQLVDGIQQIAVKIKLKQKGDF
ncbi:MAG: hypothetical protein AAF705_20130, partial [Bacteroidota bacterium]